MNAVRGPCFSLPRISTFTSVEPLLLMLGTKVSTTKHLEVIQRQHTTPSSMCEQPTSSLVGTVGESVGGVERKNNNTINNISTISSSRIGAGIQ